MLLCMDAVLLVTFQPSRIYLSILLKLVICVRLIEICISICKRIYSAPVMEFMYVTLFVYTRFFKLGLIFVYTAIYV